MNSQFRSDTTVSFRSHNITYGFYLWIRVRVRPTGQKGQYSEDLVLTLSLTLTLTLTLNSNLSRNDLSEYRHRG